MLMVGRWIYCTQQQQQLRRMGIMSRLGLNLMNFEYCSKMGVADTTGKGRKEKNKKFD
jgi:hypothetical protein